MGDNWLWHKVKPFVNGGVSGMMATCAIQPIDIVKVRIQLGAQGSPLAIAGGIIKKEGFGTLYTGLSAGLLRQATYTTARLGLFQVITDKAISANKGQPLPLYQKALCGLTAGGLGSLVGSPSDLALIRMQADGTLPVEQRRNYRNVFHSLSSIVKEDGIGGLFTGAGPTVVRAMALNMGMLASNDQAKEMLDNYGVTGAPKIVGASAIAGFFASAFSLPFDYIKTQMQKQKPNPDGTMPFKSSIDCATKTFMEGGPLRFYTGFPTYYIRIAPHSMLTLIFLNYIKEYQANNGL